MSFRAPVNDILFTMRQSAGLARAIDSGLYGDLTADLVDAVIEEAGRFATDRIAPLNRVGDTRGPRFENGAVSMPEGWHQVYTDWTQAGWNGLAASADYGGQQLPHLLGSACIEMWNCAATGFGIGPVLTIGAIEAITAHGSSALKDTYLPKMISGEWTGTMNLTEPQAGSDLAALRTRAERAGDGTYRITGQKIFITYGDHDLTDNIIHLVLARLPDAPAGTKGISLFLVPKFLVNADGSIGARNDVKVGGVEHKMGLHGSPTCTMVFGDNGGAVGWLVGEENRGLACMFTMMNNARLAVALQGVAVAERATQQAVWFANERRQGRPLGWQGEGMAPIVEHPDVKRMLLEMRSKTGAARAICYRLAAAIDEAHLAEDLARKAQASALASLLTPIAKAFATDIGSEVASLGVQVHGGMGYIEETGAAQHMRDARIFQIYEGTNGIQAIDLVTRKLPLADGKLVAGVIAQLRVDIATVRAANESPFVRMADKLDAAVNALDTATGWMLDAVKTRPNDALAGATPYARLFALALGGTMLAGEALASKTADPAHAALRLAGASFFAGNVVNAAEGLAACVLDGADDVNVDVFRAG